MSAHRPADQAHTPLPPSTPPPVPSPTTQAKSVYQERSPLHALDRFTAPVAFFQARLLGCSLISPISISAGQDMGSGGARQQQPLPLLVLPRPLPRRARLLPFQPARSRHLRLLSCASQLHNATPTCLAGLGGRSCASQPGAGLFSPHAVPAGRCHGRLTSGACRQHLRCTLCFQAVSCSSQLLPRPASVRAYSCKSQRMHAARPPLMHR